MIGIVHSSAGDFGCHVICRTSCMMSCSTSAAPKRLATRILGQAFSDTLGTPYPDVWLEPWITSQLQSSPTFFPTSCCDPCSNGLHECYHLIWQGNLRTTISSSDIIVGSSSRQHGAFHYHTTDIAGERLPCESSPEA